MSVIDFKKAKKKASKEANGGEDDDDMDYVLPCPECENPSWYILEIERIECTFCGNQLETLE